MNKLLANIAFALITVIVIVFLGRLFIITNLDKEIENTSAKLFSNQSELKIQKEKLARLNQNKTATRKEKTILLNPNQGSELMKLFFSPVIAKKFRINTYDLFSTYTFKPETENDATNQAVENVSQTVPEKTLELDENGMPINAYTDTEETEWTGLSFVPVKITFTTTAQFMYSFIKYMTNFPTNAVRSADMIMDDDGLLKGTLILSFPLKEKI